MSVNFKRQSKLCEVKIAGYPELKEKHVHLRNVGKKTTITNNFSSKKVSGSGRKDYFLLELCSGQVQEFVNHRSKKKSAPFNIVSTTGLIYNPSFKNRSKLQFVSGHNIGGVLKINVE